MKLPKLLQLPDTFDPDDRRRRQILNIILALFIAASLVSILVTFSYGNSFAEIIHDKDGILILLSSVSVVVVFSILFFLNRLQRAGTLAGWLLVLCLIAITCISDNPVELVRGRGLILWTLPILDGVAYGVVVLNDDDQVVLANPVALTLMGSGLAQLASQGKGQQELRGRVLAFTWSDVRDVGRVAIVRDSSCQAGVERAKDAMLGVVSHEMRIPLAAIIGFAEVIALRSDMAPQMAERIRVNAQRLTFMVNDLLDRAQMQPGALKVRVELLLTGILAPACQEFIVRTGRTKKPETENRDRSRPAHFHLGG